MKIISNEQYKKFLALEDQKEVIEKLEEAMNNVCKEKAGQEAIWTREKENIILDNEILLKRKDLENNNKILESTSDLIKSNQLLLLEKGNLKKEVEILTKAFENMGFDVKGMKSILDKLVEGIVSKNSINVIK